MAERELMQQALEALQAVRDTPASKDEIQRAWIVSDLLRRRLAQPDREWVGLTDEEFDWLVPYCGNEFDLKDYKDFARDIEAKLKEKNAP